MFNSIVNHKWNSPMNLDKLKPSENVTAHRINVRNNNLEELLWPPDGAHIVP